MYMPKYFSSADLSSIKKVVSENSFATIISYPKDEIPFINHLPVILSQHPGQEMTLLGHMAKRNPQWQHFQANPLATVIIHGPNAYITPTWYKSGCDVPTWNYAVIHLQGRIELVEAYSEQIEILKQLTHHFEKNNPQPWEFELPDDLKDESALTSAIISFKFEVQNIEAKFKLSQNRSVEDRRGVIEGLSRREDDQSNAVREMMMGLNK